MIFVYILTLIALTIYSFGFIDANFPIHLLPKIFSFVHAERSAASVVYILLIVSMFICYLWALKRVKDKLLRSKDVWKLIILTCIILFFSFPGLSYDIFNYVATARVTYFYKENPYIVMPIEIPNEPMLAYLQASNKVALYGPTWILATVLPYILGQGNIMVTLYSFKALVLTAYLFLSWIIWRISNKNLFSLAFFALNPVVITESLISAHNDVVMMLLALLSFEFARRNHFVWGLLLLTFSVFVKGATLVLFPIYIVVWWRSFKQKEIHWSSVWRWAAYALLVVFFLSPLREELYAWYFVWPLTFITLIPKEEFLHVIAYGLTFGLPMRFAPFIWAGEWGRWVPLAKKIISGLPPTIAIVIYGIKKKV